MAMHINDKDTVNLAASPQSMILYSKGCSVKQYSSLRLFKEFSGILWQGLSAVPFVYSNGEIVTGVTSNLL